MKKLLDQVDGTLTLVKAGIDIARSKDNPAEQLLAQRERLQSIRQELLAVREQVTALEREKAELDERLAKRVRFEHERGEFVIRKLETGSVVYVREGSGQGEDGPVIHYCAHCFKRGEQEILQLDRECFGRDEHKCGACGGKALVPNTRRARAYSVPLRKGNFLP